MPDSVPNRGPAINAVSWLLASLSFVILGLRVFVKISRHRGLWWDDYFILASWIAQLISIILITINVSKGFGKHSADLDLTYPEIVGISLRGAVNGTFLVLSAAWSKTSFAATLLRLTQGWPKKFVMALAISMNAFLTACVIINFFNCNPPSKTWDPMKPGTCWNVKIPTAVNVSSSAYSAACDFLLSAVPWLVISKLQMKTSEKIGVGVAMSMGAFVAAVGIVKTVQLNQLHNQDFSYHGGNIQIWSVVEISLTIIAASIPILRPFLRDTISSGGRYITASGERTGRTDVYGQGRTQRSFATAVRSQARDLEAEVSDTGSDKGIINTSGNQIMKTDVITVEFEARKQAVNGEYELDNMDPGHY